MERWAGAAGGWRKAPCWVLKEQPRQRELWLLFRNDIPGMTWPHIPFEDSCVVGRPRWGGCGGFRGLVWGLWVVGWLLVENCTVDASILFFVVKLSRANGGCLGTRSR